MSGRLTRVAEMVKELSEAHDEWMNEDAGGARLHEAVVALRDELRDELDELSE